MLLKVTRTFAAHYGEYILHPVESLLQCSCPVFDCGSFEVQKQSVSNAFQYVVLRPSAQLSSESVAAASGRCSCKAAIKREQNQACLNSAEREQSRGFNRKSTKYFGIKCSQSKKSAKKSRFNTQNNESFWLK